MKNSATRILTTHVGCLQRPDELTQAMLAHLGARHTDTAFAARLQRAAKEAATCCRIWRKTVDTRGSTMSTMAREFADFVLDPPRLLEHWNS